MARHQAPVALSEHVGHCGQRKEAGRILRRATQQPSATLGIQGPDAGRDVLWNGRWNSEETGSREAASSRTQTEDKPGTELSYMFRVGVRQLLSRQRIQTGQPCAGARQDQSTRTVSSGTDKSASSGSPRFRRLNAIDAASQTEWRALARRSSIGFGIQQGTVPKVLV